MKKKKKRKKKTRNKNPIFKCNWNNIIHLFHVVLFIGIRYTHSSNIFLILQKEKKKKKAITTHNGTYIVKQMYDIVPVA